MKGQWALLRARAGVTDLDGCPRETKRYISGLRPRKLPGAFARALPVNLARIAHAF